MSDLLELFARDPLNLNARDIGQIVAELRKMRRSFNEASVAAKAPKAKAAPKKPAGPALDLEIDL